MRAVRAFVSGRAQVVMEAERYELRAAPMWHRFDLVQGAARVFWSVLGAGVAIFLRGGPIGRGAGIRTRKRRQKRRTMRNQERLRRGCTSAKTVW